MRRHLLKSIAFIGSCLFGTTGHAQCHYIPSTSVTMDTVAYYYIGGAFQSYGCAPIDPTRWFSGSGMSVNISFVNPTNYPSIRVWGMNDDDVASVMVNGLAYPLNASTASYDLKTVCGISPGPDGVLFSGGNLVGANSNAQGNFSFNNVTLNASNVNSITLTGMAGAGWGFAGVSVDCETSVIANQEMGAIDLFPNPTTSLVSFQGKFPENTMITITNPIGEIVGKMPLINNTIDISELPTGIYFISMEMNEQIVCKRITKI